MRFNRCQNYGPFEDTRRKRLALARKQRLEREKFPLLAELIAEQQPDADSVMRERADQWARWMQDRRQRQADLWRQARRKLWSYSGNVRRALYLLWQHAPYPATPVYLLDMLHSFDVGRLDPDSPPWIYRGPGLRAVDLDAICERARARMAAGASA